MRVITCHDSLPGLWRTIIFQTSREIYKSYKYLYIYIYICVYMLSHIYLYVESSKTGSINCMLIQRQNYIFLDQKKKNVESFCHNCNPNKLAIFPNDILEHWHNHCCQILSFRSVWDKFINSIWRWSLILYKSSYSPPPLSFLLIASIDSGT